MTGRGGFSPVTYPVARQVAVAFASHGSQGSQGSEPDECRAFGAEVQDYARRHLQARPGYFVLTGLEHLTEAQARDFAMAASKLLGEAMSQDFRGATLREVRDRGVQLEGSATARYSDTRHGGNPHTDGVHHPGHVPDFVTLYCVRQAQRGGALVLVHVDDLLERLRLRPDVLATLRVPVHFDTRDNGTPGVPRTVQRPVLEGPEGAERIHYLRDYIESGHRHAGIPPLSAGQVAALDALDALLREADLQQRGRLRAGEMIFVNNRSVIHARTTFEDGAATGNGRLLLRVWLAAPTWPFLGQQPLPPPGGPGLGTAGGVAVCC